MIRVETAITELTPGEFDDVFYGATHRYIEIAVDGVGLVGWIRDDGWHHIAVQRDGGELRTFGLIEAWCNWEWEEIGLCRPLSA